MARISKAQLAINEANEAAIKEAQRVELARMRKEKREKNKLAKTENTVLDKPAFDPAAEDAERRAKIAAAWESFMDGFEVPSWKRALSAIVVSLLAAFGTGYLIGTLAGMLIVATVALTGAAWIAWVIFVLAIIASGYLGSQVASRMYGYIADKKIDAHASAAKNKVLGWFKPRAVEQFSGAHAA